jgi:quercetin dioxygenase-like cupin family protein
MVATLLERFNSGKVTAMMSLYAPEAVLIAKDGRTITDHTEIAAQLERDLKLGLPLEAKARHVFVADDIAQIVLDWSIDGTGPDGKHAHLGGSASDIVRRGADGRWRYLIDNNQGTAVRQPADAHDSEAPTVTKNFEAAIPNIPGKSLLAVEVDYAPGAASPSHAHAKSAFIYAFVISGAIESKVNDGETRIYRAGESWSEPPGAIHSISRNASKTESAKLLAVFVLDTNDNPLTTPIK